YFCSSPPRLLPAPALYPYTTLFRSRSRLPASGTPRGVPLLTSAGGWGPQNSAGPTPPDLAAGPPSSPFVWTAPLSPVAGRLPAPAATSPVPLATRSEERRVGKECRVA